MSKGRYAAWGFAGGLVLVAVCVLVLCFPARSAYAKSVNNIGI